MQNNYHLSVINFNVKTSSSDRFFEINTMLDVKYFLNVVSMVSRGVLENYVECCNHVPHGV